MRSARSRSLSRPPRHSRGIVLLIALIVLVAMSLAGVALMRSVDSSVAVAGNLAFKQASVVAADRGTQEAMTWLWQNRPFVGPMLDNSNLSRGYFSARPPVEPDWTDLGSWTSAVVLNGGNPDNSGNVVRYVIHRMCNVADAPWGAAGSQQCSLYFPQTGATEGVSRQVGTPQYQGNPQLYYRVTTRVDGPRNNVTIIQSTALF